MGAVVWAMIVGPLMWVPVINIIVGAIAAGWGGAFVGLLLTMAVGGGGAQSENVRSTVKRKTSEWWTILGVSPEASREEVAKAYRAKAKKAHPDHGGNTAKMAELNRAREEALKDL